MTINITTLTDRERVVLLHLCDGLTPQEIAVAEYVSIHTVRTQIRGIFMKHRVNTLHAAVVHAYRTGIVRL